MLANSERPLVLVGGSRWDEAACVGVREFAEANDLPVAAVFRRQDRFDNDHGCYVGDVGIGINPTLRARVQDSDLLVVIGARLGEMTTGGYTLIDIPNPRQRLVHVHAGAEELNRVYQPDLAINATPRGFAAMLDDTAPISPARWKQWREEARADYEAWQEPSKIPGRLQMGEIAVWLRQNLPPDAIVTNGAGNFSSWMHRFHRWRRLGTQLAPVSGSMGYGLPAAVAAKLRHPERTVACMAGDGDILMNSQELATATQYRANVIVVVIDNGMYGTIRMHQERHYPDRAFATDLKNPDFVALAKAYGGYGERVETAEEFPAAFARASNADRPALLHLLLDPEAITTSETLSAVRRAAKQGA
jgi:acetolactate synthase-1/2/3 large subunit